MFTLCTIGEIVFEAMLEELLVKLACSGFRFLGQSSPHSWSSMTKNFAALDVTKSLSRKTDFLVEGLLAEYAQDDALLSQTADARKEILAAVTSITSALQVRRIQISSRQSGNYTWQQVASVSYVELQLLHLLCLVDILPAQLPNPGRCRKNDLDSRNGRNQLVVHVLGTQCCCCVRIWHCPPTDQSDHGRYHIDVVNHPRSSIFQQQSWICPTWYELNWR